MSHKHDGDSCSCIQGQQFFDDMAKYLKARNSNHPVLNEACIHAYMLLSSNFQDSLKLIVTVAMLEEQIGEFMDLYQKRKQQDEHQETKKGAA